MVMKNFLLFFIISVVLLLNITCSKDEIETNEVKSESVDNSLPSSVVENRSPQNTSNLIFYRTSLTTDNYLVGSPTPRTHVIFNKKKIKDIIFKSSGQGLVNIGGTLCKHYNIQINYVDNTKENLSAYSKSSDDTFTFIPTGTNLLVDTHTAKKITIISTNTSTYTVPQYYNFWRNTKTNWAIWKIYVDNQFTQQRYLEPLDKNSTQFLPPHAH